MLKLLYEQFHSNLEIIYHILFLLFNISELPQIQNLAQHMKLFCYNIPLLREGIAASFNYFIIIKVNDFKIPIQFFAVLFYGILQCL